MKKMTGWLVTLLFSLVLICPALAAPKYADVEVPGTIRVIVSYNAGGSSDTLARVTLPTWEKAIEELTGKDYHPLKQEFARIYDSIKYTPNPIAYLHNDLTFNNLFITDDEKIA